MSNGSIHEGLKEECGVFGVFDHSDAVDLTYYGLHALQHRGQDSAGIVSSDGRAFTFHHGTGLVTDVFKERTLTVLSGDRAIGHVRNATDKGNLLANAQPLVFNYRGGELALAVNGNLMNATSIRDELEQKGSIFQTTSDAEVIAHLIARLGHSDLRSAAKEALRFVKGAYAFLMLTNEKLVAALDPHGIRPLVVGKLGQSYVVASETCAFDAIGAVFEREVEPGELIVIDRDGLHSECMAEQAKGAKCSFEYIYFARPDSEFGHQSVHSVRKRLGQQLYEEAPAEADVVTGVPDSSISAAIGYAEAAGYPYELGLVKNRYVGRTFIQPHPQLREQGVKMKLSAVKRVVEGKRVVMVDDSVVRGTTSRRIVRLLRDAGATEVHVRIGAPPVRHPCVYGIDTPDRDGLIASGQSVETICRTIEADSLAFLSIPGLLKAIGRHASGRAEGLCLACFDGMYPTERKVNLVEKEKVSHA